MQINKPATQKSMFMVVRFVMFLTTKHLSRMSAENVRSDISYLHYMQIQQEFWFWVFVMMLLFPLVHVLYHTHAHMNITVRKLLNVFTCHTKLRYFVKIYMFNGLYMIKEIIFTCFMTFIVSNVLYIIATLTHKSIKPIQYNNTKDNNT